MALFDDFAKHAACLASKHAASGEIAFTTPRRDKPVSLSLFVSFFAMSQNSDVNLQSTFGFHSRQENKRYLTSYISQKSKMVEATTIVKALGTAIALPGLFMTLIVSYIAL
jgi:hypothetical protein